MTALTAIVLIVGAGLCAFDLPGHDHAVDLCLSVFLVASGPILMVILLRAERLTPVGVCTPYLTSLDPLAPPPKA